MWALEAQRDVSRVCIGRIHVAGPRVVHIHGAHPDNRNSEYRYWKE